MSAMSKEPTYVSVLDKYFSEVEKAAAFSERSGIHQVTLSQYRTGERDVKAEHCPLIERLTDSKVTCEQMRPDVEWGYLRGTKKAA